MVIVDVLPLCAFHIHSSIERLHHVLFSPAIPMQEVGFQMGLVLWVSVKRSYFNKSITRRLLDPYVLMSALQLNSHTLVGSKAQCTKMRSQMW